MKKSITGCFKAVSSWLESFHNILTLYLRTAKYIYLTYNMGLDILREYLQEYFIQEKGPERGRKERKEKRKEGERDSKSSLFKICSWSSRCGAVFNESD